MKYCKILLLLYMEHGPAVGRVFAQLLLQERAHTILVGSCGSDMLKIPGGTGILILAGMTGSVRGTVEQFKGSCRSGLS